MHDVPSEPKPRRFNLGWILAGLLLLASKAKGLLVLLKALPFTKVLLTGGSMFAMVAFEAQRMGWWFAVGFVFLILIHELGHGFAMKQRGVSAGWPIFIPFFGAMIAMKDRPQDRDTEAVIAYGGPVAGTAASLAVAAFGLTGSPGMLSLAFAGFTLNLFNLLPLSPLDGGRVAQAFSKNAWKFGGALLLGLFFVTGSPQLLLIGLLALPRLLQKDTSDEHVALAPELQRLWAVRYFGLVGFLAASAYFCQRLIQSASQAA
jgi:Zn-dependent protease